jgi:arginase
MRVALIEVPYDSGRERERMGAGPPHLAAALATALRAGGHDVAIAPVRLPTGFFAEVAAVQALVPRVRAAVGAARDADRLPVVLAGNCGVAALGVTGALVEPGVLWLDAHGDFNTPEISPSGFFDGTSLAALVGRCWRAAMGRIAGFRPLAEERVVLAGARDLDEEERALLVASRVRRVDADALRGDASPIAAALGEVAATGARSFYLHVDLDVLDPEELRANLYAAPGGLRLADLLAAVAAAARVLPVGALALTAYDPASDEAQRGGPIATRVVEAVLAATARGEHASPTSESDPPSGSGPSGP